MRPKIVATIFLLAIGLLTLVYLVSRAFPPITEHPMPVSAVAVASPTATVSESPRVEKNSVSSAVTSVDSKSSSADPATVADSAAPQDTKPAVDAQQRVSELMSLAMNNDTDSLNIIWSELSNPDQEIREGAVAAVVQFGDRSLAPRLRERAAQIQDPQEKSDMLAAADQLDLPPLGETQTASAPR